MTSTSSPLITPIPLRCWTRIVLGIAVLFPSSPLRAQDATWWSFRSLAAPAVPNNAERHPIEAFLTARRSRAGLRRAEAADRRVLIRRATVALHGLLPTPEEIDAFVGDLEPGGYDRLIERLLASPRYGERWARHWLDVAHYGDTHGFDKDKVRPNAWPYRDWVISAINEDMPWKRFVSMQLAGDVLYPDDPDGIVATGFIAAGPWDYVGHVELREGTVDKEITRDLDRDDMVTSAMSAFTSLTVHCARCHDHKFDPISQSEYFGLQAVFAGVERADRPYEPADVAGRRKRLEADRADLRTRLEELSLQHVGNPDIDRQVASRAALQSRLDRLPPLAPPTSPGNGWHSAIMREADHRKWVEVDLGADHKIDEIRIWPARPTDFRDTPGFGFPVRYTVVVDSDAASHPRMIADATERDASNPGDEPVVIRVDGPVRKIRITGTRLWKRNDDYVMAFAEVEALANGVNVALGATVRSRDSIEAGRWGKKRLVDGFTSRDRIGAEPPGIAERRAIAARLRSLDAAIRSARLEQERRTQPDRARQRRDVRAILDGIELALTERIPPPGYVYAAARSFRSEGQFRPPPDGRPRPVHVLERGDVTKPLELAVPRGLSAITSVPSSFGDELASEGVRRAALAHWITHDENPLTWRSIVNRVWHHHFGRGLVATPNDFGKMGARPSHPELLDWLATRFRNGGGSLKDLHRLILTSPSWLQRSAHDSEAAAKDADNRLLWRAPRRRLEAEAVRDAVLQAAGTLDLTMGGPGYRPFGFKDDHSPHYLYDAYDPTDRTTWRRAIYRLQVRSVPDPFLETLDCPDPSRSVPARMETMTALQALALLNDRFMLEQSGRMASRLEREAASRDDRVTLAVRLTLGRRPTAAERRLLSDYAARHGLPALCRVLFNLNEFLFVD